MNLSNNKVLSIIVGLVGLIWCTIIMMVGHIIPSIPTTGSLLFGILATVIVIGYFMYCNIHTPIEAVEVKVLPVFYSIVFFIVVLIMNTIFIVIKMGSLNSILFIGNIVIFTIYAIMILLAEKNTENVTNRLDRSRNMVSAHADISSKLDEILAAAENEEVRKEIYELKTLIFYSSGKTTDKTVVIEEEIMGKLDDLMHMVISHTSAESIGYKVKEIEKLWKMRCVK